jgi:hypothetical protein
MHEPLPSRTRATATSHFRRPLPWRALRRLGFVRHRGPRLRRDAQRIAAQLRQHAGEQARAIACAQ